jgi:hypothetical protein
MLRAQLLQAACANRKSANVSCHSDAQYLRPSRRASCFPPRAVPALPLRAASDHSAPRSLPAGKPQRPSNRPNGRPFGRLLPSPNLRARAVVQNGGIKSEMAGGDWRRAYNCSSAQLHCSRDLLLRHERGLRLIQAKRQRNRVISSAAWQTCCLTVVLRLQCFSLIGHSRPFLLLRDKKRVVIYHEIY